MPNQSAQPESRVKKTLLNARVNLIFYLLTIILSFFSRKIFLDNLGTSFIGLTGTLQNLLGFLNLAELGIGSAIGYVLYKPIFEKDQNKIIEIISVMGYLYRRIGLVVLVSGIILSAFLPLIFPETPFSLPIIYFAFYAFLLSSLIGYFINYRQNLLGADQKNYIITGYFQTTTIIKTIIQMILAYYTRSYIIWISIEISFGIIYSFILNWRINKAYPWLKSSARLGKSLFKKYPEVMKYTKQLFAHQINGFAQYQTTPFLTYAFVSLQTVAFLGNYNLVLDKIFLLMNTFFGSATAGVGNLIAEGNKSKIMKVFWEYSTLRFYTAGFCAFVCIMGLNSLIEVWLGKEYIMEKIVLVLLIIKLYVQVITGNTYSFIYGYGMFNDVWASVAQSVIFLTTAILGGYFYGICGILFAGILSIGIIQGIWKPYFLFKNGMKCPIISYWKKWTILNIINIISITLSGLIIHYLQFCKFATNFFDWLINNLLYAGIYIVVSIFTYLIFSSSARQLSQRVCRIRKRPNTI